MYGIYSNIGGILMGSMLPYIYHTWILWVSYNPSSEAVAKWGDLTCGESMSQSPPWRGRPDSATSTQLVSGGEIKRIQATRWVL